MNSATIKLDMLERLAGIKDDAIIQRISALLKKKFPEVMEEGLGDFTDEEEAELEERYQEMVSGKVKGHTREESMRLVRKGTKG